MKEPVLVALSPDRGNIVNDKFDVDQLSDLLYEEMSSSQAFPKTVVFVRRYTDCSELYSILEHKLGSEVTSYPEFRRIEMYSRVQTVEKKEKTFCSRNGTIDISFRVRGRLPKYMEDYPLGYSSGVCAGSWEGRKGWLK